MTRTPLPAGIDADVAIDAAGTTYVARQDVAGGLVVEAFLTDPTKRTRLSPGPNEPGSDAFAAAQGCGRLLVSSGFLFYAFKNKNSDLAVWDRAAGVTRTFGPAFNSQPIQWVQGAAVPTLAVQRPADCHVEVAAYPEVPSTSIGGGAPTGLSRVTVDPQATPAFTVLTMDGARAEGFDDPCFLSSYEWVAQAQQGGIWASLATAEGATMGYLLQGAPGGTFQPRIARAPDGTYTIVCGSRGGRGAGPLTLLTGVTAADLEAFRPPIVPLTKPRLFVTFAFNGVTEPAGNAAIAIRGDAKQWQGIVQSGRQLIATPDLIGQIPANVISYIACDLEVPTSSLDDAHRQAHAIGKGVYIFAPTLSDAAIAGSQDGDVLADELYLNAGETPTQFQTRCRARIAYVLARKGLRVLYAPIWGTVKRYDATGAVVVDVPVVRQGLAVASSLTAEFDIDVSTFREGTTDHDPIVDADTATWQGGQPAPDPLPIPAQEDAVNSPGVNITSFGADLGPSTNWKVEVEDRNNPGTKVTVELLRGDLHVTLQNPAGSDRSGLTRKVNIHG